MSDHLFALSSLGMFLEEICYLFSVSLYCVVKPEQDVTFRVIGERWSSVLNSGDEILRMHFFEEISVFHCFVFNHAVWGFRELV